MISPETAEIRRGSVTMMLGSLTTHNTANDHFTIDIVVI